MNLQVTNAKQASLGGKKNGELLAIAELQGFEIFVTVDKRLEYEKNLAGRRIAVVILRAKSNRIADLVPLMKGCLSQIGLIGPGQMARIEE